ncbi:expressed unknown protein [Seminavis robusta]|uniref:Uncharacterized protein n=1 Tax=Seminavis robusta TaxID=568900 RepID=A0A9N8HVZ8_9STRA|nr:expressed unknown protein [Seminavis robusta]|eukprot:Sro2041_g312270.1 n/a (180) ;mRNA; f:16972-17511
MDGVLAPWPEDYDDDDEGDDAYDDDAMAGLEHCDNEVSEESVAAFSELLSAIPEEHRKVVFSSAWRLHKTCTQHILDIFCEYGEKHGGPLKDLKLFDSRTGEHHESRQIEIARWVMEHAKDGIAAWVALDDRGSILKEPRYLHLFKGHAVVTEKHVGLTSDDVKDALDLVKHQLLGELA